MTLELNNLAGDSEPINSMDGNSFTSVSLEAVDKSDNKLTEANADDNQKLQYVPTGELDSLINELDGALNPPTSSAFHDEASAVCVESNGCDSDIVNGCKPDLMQRSLEKMGHLYEKYSAQCQEMEKLEKSVSDLKEQLAVATKERWTLQNQLSDSNQRHTSKIVELERKILDHEYQTKTLKDRMAAQEQHHKRLLTDLQQKCNKELEQLRKSTETAQRDKDAAVVKYANREKEILDLQQSKLKAMQQCQQATTERDALQARLRGAKNDKDALLKLQDTRENEVTDLRREIERLKSFLSEADVRVKVANQRVDDVERAHKETKSELEKVSKRLQDAKEETETIRQNCQQIIKQYQENEEIKSIALDHELKKKLEEMKVQKQERSDQEEIYKMIQDELEALKKQHKSTMRELEETHNELASNQGALAAKEDHLATANRIVESLKAEVTSLKSSMDDCDAKGVELEKWQEKCRTLQRRVDDLQEEAEDLKRDAQTCQRGAEDMLALTEKLTQRCTALQSEHNALENKVTNLERSNSEAIAANSVLTSAMSDLQSTYDEYKASTSAQISRLEASLSAKSTTESELSTKLHDEQNQNTILKKKHAASLKELKSELNVMKRRLEAYETGSQHSVGSGATADEPSRVPSRASSVSSLDGAIGGFKSSVASVADSPPSTVSQQHNVTSYDHSQAMIEKIVKLQRMLARRNEKIEFMEEHCKQLLLEMQKKAKVIQSYALREESGALANEASDMHKVQMSRKGHSIMGSVFGGSQTTDAHMTLELSLQINQKLQAVLEDTLLKNITFKESLETLGHEISRLSRENRELKNKLSIT